MQRIRNSWKTRGQSLIEILVALGLGVILIGGVTALITVNLRSSSESKIQQAASSLTQEVIDAAKSKAEANWNTFYALGKTSANKYYIASSTQVITAGTEPLALGEYTFTRYFYIENVNRTQCGTGALTVAATTGACNSNFPDTDIAEDPSTQKITVVIEWGGDSIKQEQYVSRSRNVAMRQTDWSGGGGETSVLVNPNDKYDVASAIDTTTTPGAFKVMLSGGGGGATTANIDGSEPNHWAWNDAIGWIDFTPAIVGVNNDKLFGYGSSSVGSIAFDCATSPSPTCAGAAGNWRVSNVGGALKGWAYNDSIGWISFNCDHTADGTQAPYNTNTCGVTSYGVNIDGTGEFKGWAYNDSIGWISFNCDHTADGTQAPYNTNTCGAFPYRVKTGWTSTPDTGSITSPIFDLGSRVALNSFIWKGVENGGGVRFQIAASTVSNPGSWVYKGPDGTSTSYYEASSPDASTVLSPKDFSNVQYVRYKVFVDSNAGRTDGPEVRDIILSYSL